MGPVAATSRLDSAVNPSNESIARSMVTPITDGLVGAAFELISDGLLPGVVSWWTRAAEWSSSSPKGSFILGEGSFGAANTNKANATGIWLFGPEKAPTPRKIFASLASHLPADGMAIVASSFPQCGKKLTWDRFGKYTHEEMISFFIRSGLGGTIKCVPGPGFGIWTAKKTEDPILEIIATASESISIGDAEAAEKTLGNVISGHNCTEVALELTLMWAACHDISGRMDLCKRSLLQAASLSPSSARALTGLGRLSLLEGDLKDARGWFSSALKIEPALVAALRGMAITNEKDGLIEDAYKCLFNASRLRPRDASLACQAARVGAQIGRRHEAEGLVFKRSSIPAPLIA